MTVRLHKDIETYKVNYSFFRVPRDFKSTLIEGFPEKAPKV